MTFETDVVIVGAGAAGLSAAKELQKRGLSYVVIEGSHRIGGRAYSEEISSNTWFDLGCSYLHQGDSNPFRPIADDMEIPLNHARADLFSHVCGIRNGVPLAEEETARFEKYYEDSDKAIEALVSGGKDCAIFESIDMENEFFNPYSNWMSIINNMDIDETSAADYIDDGSDEDALHLDIPVPNGFGNLVKAWGADVDVTLNCAVEKIDWSGPGVSVETVKGTIRGRTVLITVSTGILAASLIQFNPVLPDWKIESYLGLPVGTVNKTCLHFEKDVFGPDNLGLYSTWNDADDTAFLEASVNGNNTAIVFTGGRFGVWLEKQGQQASIEFAVERVADVFGNDIRKYVTNSIATAWATEPWSLGAYSCASPGQAHQREEIAKPIDNILFFAGEATINKSNSTCHGAYYSGLRAAQEIVESLGTN